MLSFLIIQGVLIYLNPRYVPSVEAIDLTPILTKENLTEEDYALLFEQTGLTQPVIEELATLPNFMDKMLTFQKDYLNDISVVPEFLPPITISEALRNNTGGTAGFTLAPYHNGYILLTKSTYTMNWRHGHAGIVIDEVRGITLEALNPGTYSMEQPISKWQYYPTFKMMRLKDTPQDTLDDIAAYASSTLKNLPYNILADKDQGQTPYDTHCSLLIWQAFHHFGYDLDATGGLFVSPKNIAMSPLLEVLQIYGFNPNEVW